MSKAPKKSAIIFLNPPYGAESEQLRQDITKLCKTNNFSIIKIIQAKGIYDTRALHKLTHKIRDCKNKPDIVIIDNNLKSPVNIIQCCVFEALIGTGLIEIITFERKNDSQLTFKVIEKSGSTFLHCAAIYYKSLMNSISSKTA